VREQLNDLLKRGSFPHALLFAGPKGTGKTSAARIISAVLNDPANRAAAEQLFAAQKSGATDTAPASAPTTTKPVKKNSLVEPDVNNELVQRIFRGTSMVVRELDAASNRGIDDIRALKEQMYLPPQEGFVTTYILDEVHMLTIEAFNALLKLLEEPPPQVLFILATTERHKIPDTIVSRCTVVQFHRATEAELRQSLQNILDKEHITVDPDVLSTVVARADGSFRDGVKLLETVAAGKQHVTAADADRILPSVAEADVWRFLTAIVEKNEKAVLAVLDERRATGLDPAAFFAALVRLLYKEWHALTLDEPVPNGAHFSLPITQYLLQQFMQVIPVRQPVVPYLELELKAVELISKSREKKKPEESSASGSAKNAVGNSSGTAPQPPLRRPLASPVHDAVSGASYEAVVTSPLTDVQSQILAPILPTQAAPLSDREVGDGKELIARWDDFLSAVHEHNPSIEALLRSAKPLEGDLGRAQVEVYYQFHREQLEQPKFQRLLEEAVATVLGKTIQFEFSLAKSSQVGAPLSDVSGKVSDEHIAQLAQELLV
jgi:DNA polymerase III gamma/tau subunit